MGINFSQFAHHHLDEVKVRMLARKVKKCSSQELIFIFGLPRSGTTWMSECFQNWQGTLPLFEPIHARVLESKPAFTMEDWVGSLTLTKDELSVVEGILKGKISSRWIFSETTFLKALQNDYSRLCIKLINCNNSVQRLERSLKLALKPLCIIRHPYTNILSWKELGWENRFGRLQERFHYLIEANPDWNKTVMGLSDPISQMAASWFLGNFEFLRPRDPVSTYILVKYEDIKKNPPKYLEYIFKQWGINQVPPSVILGCMKQSKTTWKEQKKKDKGSLSEFDKKIISNTLEAFGLSISEDFYALNGSESNSS